MSILKIGLFGAAAAALIGGCGTGLAGAADTAVAESSASANLAGSETLARNEVECAAAFREMVPLKTIPVKGNPAKGDPLYWSWRHPARVDEVDGPLDLDGDGMKERVFVGTYVPQGGSLEADASTLVIVSEKSPLFLEINATELNAIFNRQMAQRTPEDRIPNVESEAPPESSREHG